MKYCCQRGLRKINLRASLKSLLLASLTLSDPGFVFQFYLGWDLENPKLSFHFWGLFMTPSINDDQYKDNGENYWSFSPKKKIEKIFYNKYLSKNLENSFIQPLISWSNFFLLSSSFLHIFLFLKQKRILQKVGSQALLGCSFLEATPWANRTFFFFKMFGRNFP